MIDVKEGQIYTFNNDITYYIINHIEDDNDIWYQIWQAKEIPTKENWWFKIYPNEIIFVDIDFISKYEFEEWYNVCGKYVGLINKDYGLNNNWNMVKKNKATKLWFKMTEDIG